MPVRNYSSFSLVVQITGSVHVWVIGIALINFRSLQMLTFCCCFGGSPKGCVCLDIREGSRREAKLIS